MSDMTPCRLLLDPPAAGAWNMAVDEVLLEWSAEYNGCCLRMYRWSEPTLSLGYFQAYRDRWAHAPSRDCPVVRRLTGGGAIIHDVELTYSLVVPGGHSLARHRNLLYETVHNSLIAALAEFDVAARLHQSQDPTPRGEEPFLCFRRRAAGDVLADPIKIAGSAQRRRRGAVLQHGSVLLRRSAAAPELDGLAEIAAGAPDARQAAPDEQLADAWLPRLSEELVLTWHSQPLSVGEARLADALVESRYASPQWTEKNSR